MEVRTTIGLYSACRPGDLPAKNIPWEKTRNLST
jgi:hypothetical protein